MINLDFMEGVGSEHARCAKSWYENVVVVGECVTSTNKVNQDGYLRVACSKHRRLRMAHVIIFEHVNGPIPEGMEVNHKCRNRRCFNPDHLELLEGSVHTTLTNVNRVGYTMNRASDEDIMYFYYLVKSNTMSINKVCEEFGIKRSTLSSIINKRSRVLITDWVDSYINFK